MSSSEKRIQWNQIKLVIWDLDDTFWAGTLSEGPVAPVPENEALVRTLAGRGIISSICSKNDRAEAEKQLSASGMLSWFVFSSIDWTPKGQRVKRLIKDIGLREENVLFLDDNPGNLREAEYYCPELMTAGPEAIASLTAAAGSLGKDDASLSRLKQYQLLEKKARDSQAYSSNEEFLFDSDIVLDIRPPSEAEFDRVLELIQRTNQLNFTKRRSTAAELRELLDDPSVDVGCVHVRDKYGSYGMVGFYAVRDRAFVHFLFSCRTMGMGIEQYVYAALDYPALSVASPVSGALHAGAPAPAYIRRGDAARVPSPLPPPPPTRILLKGPCDLEVMASYLTADSHLTTEFNFMDGEGRQVDFYNHSVNVLNTLFLPEEEKTRLSQKYSFLSRDAYRTTLFSAPYDVVCLSVLMDATLAVYRHRDKGYQISYGLYSKPATEPEHWPDYLAGNVMTARSPVSEETLRAFAEEFETVAYTPDDVVNNFKEILSQIHKITPDAKLIFLTLPELAYDGDSSLPAGKERIHGEINRAMYAAFRGEEQLRFLDVNRYVTRPSDYFDNINHYSKLVYFKMARELIRMIHEETAIELSSASRSVAIYRHIKRELYKKVKNIREKKKRGDGSS